MLELYQNNFSSDFINNNIVNLFNSGSHHLKGLDCNGHQEVGTIKCEKNYELCEGCGLKIHDQFLMQIADSRWHESCLSCCCCNIPLTTSCYVKNSKLYCKSDYERLFAIKCPGCCQKIQSNDMVMRTQNFIFHQPCFTCCICRTVLQKGEQYILRSGGQLVCLRHGPESELSQFYDEDIFLEDFITRRDGRRGPKRPRTILTSQQRKQFKAAFETSPKPCRKIREALAKDTGLSVRVVQVWFQNQRAKMKKIQRKASKNSTTDDKANEKDADDKDNKESSENDEYLGFSSQPLNPNVPFSPDDFPTNSNDSFCSSDVSMEDFDDDMDGDLDGSFENIMQQVPNQITTSTNNNVLINPIDKLYLMQNSYFSEV